MAGGYFAAGFTTMAVGLPLFNELRSFGLSAMRRGTNSSLYQQSGGGAHTGHTLQMVIKFLH
jgi:hypothetical protein